MNEEQELKEFPSHIRITSYSDWPYSILINNNGSIDGDGFAFELLKLLVRKFNFTYTIVPPAEDIIGDQKSDEMDTTFLMKRPGTSSSGSGLLAPFTEQVWILIFISLLIVGPTIYLMILLRSKFAKDEQAEKFTFLTCMWFVYGALLKQGTTFSPIGDSTRLVFATWWIFITILTSYYTANLTAFLTLSKFTLAINSLDELVNYRYSWFIINGRSVQTLLHYNDPEVEALTKSRNWGYGYLYNDYNMTYKSMLKYARDGKVFIADRILAQMAIFEDYKNKTLEGIIEEKRCAYVISESNVLPKRRGFGLPTRSPIQKFINSEMTAAIEGGLVKHFKLEKLPEAQICPLNLKSKERRLKISDLWMTYKVVFAGMGVSIIVFLIEFFSRLIRKCVESNAFVKYTSGKIKNIDASPESWNYIKESTNFWIRTPPPMYQLHEEISRKTYSINGRDYYVINEESGDRRLIPIRTSSAYLFQYIH
ncbi:PREDICTED: glutamate receptor ionotropic, kainate 2 [Ceratosolen solmsi marchali]|uniref:Glutamate receptor ionotropic, kainate 2 n=1 Tax=Ceratosolen solmsi marchali TaxID=326594 RepID=A0AAJ7DYN8_9HYME|nr:PREDICTED: glutamate receptor ionotropic, kainate 2 [Ceratosolen solmsi marchali]